jgi:hypothetical protein
VITAYFNSFGIFSAEEIAATVKLFESRLLNKGDFFVRETERTVKLLLYNPESSDLFIPLLMAMTQHIASGFHRICWRPILLYNR